MAILTVQVLEGLLSPDAGLRSESSAFLSRLSAEDKCLQLLRLLPSLGIDGSAAGAAHVVSPSNTNASAAPAAAAAEPFRQLIFVLMRREVLKVASVAALGDFVDPLLGVFTGCLQGSGGGGRTASLVGECLASVIQSLEQLETLATPTHSFENRTSDASLAACHRVLAAIATPVRTSQLVLWPGIGAGKASSIAFRIGLTIRLLLVL
jgi:hypothetical protein